MAIGNRVMHAVAWLTLLGPALAQETDDPTGGLSGTHTDIPRWCGKPYIKGAPNFDPGGMTLPPSSPPKDVDIQIVPHHSIYVDSEDTAAFIVNVSLPRMRKGAIATCDGHPANVFHFDIRLADTGGLLLANVTEVTTGPSLFEFDLGCLTPRLKPYVVVMRGSLACQRRGHQMYTTTAQLYYLPAKNTGSMVKVDNLNGGMLVANEASEFAFEPILPFGFYASCSGYLNYSLSNVTAYKDLGFNAINPVCAFTDGDLSYLFDWLDETSVWYQYDMRNSYLNLSSVASQIPLIKDRPYFLSWYTADEPDGWQYALNSTKLTYDLLKREDPYHPTSLVLNCQNYYYEEYAAGADYIMEDAYPVGINATFSRPYGIPCNETYGDCGCDNCIGELKDVSNRLDNLYDYQTWSGQWHKPLWGVLQAFGNASYWSREPTPQESWVMMLLAFNHRAKGMMSWDLQSLDVLAAAHGNMASVVTASPVKDSLIGGQPTTVAVGGNGMLDAAYWTQNDNVLLSLVNAGDLDCNGSLTIGFPLAITGVASQPWGNLSYFVGVDGDLQVACVPALASSLVILEID